jgi:hypothetical protein
MRTVAYKFKVRVPRHGTVAILRGKQWTPDFWVIEKSKLGIQGVETWRS